MWQKRKSLETQSLATRGSTEQLHTLIEKRNKNVASQNTKAIWYECGTASVHGSAAIPGLDV